MSSRIIYGIVILFNLFICIWSFKYLNSYARQDTIAAIAYGLIFSTGLYCINNILIHLIDTK